MECFAPQSSCSSICSTCHINSCFGFTVSQAMQKIMRTVLHQHRSSFYEAPCYILTSIISSKAAVSQLLHPITISNLLHCDQDISTPIFTSTRISQYRQVIPIQRPTTNMPRRNPDRRRKQSRKTHSQKPSFDRAGHYQQYNNTMYADGDVLAAARFSEDSVRRQLGYTIPPPQQISGDITPRWRTGYWYTYTHPVHAKM